MEIGGKTRHRWAEERKAGKEVAGTLSQDQIRKIAEAKMPDLNAKTIEGAMRIVEGTARSMGVKVQD